MDRFRKILGEPQDVVVGIGDWEQHQHRKFKEPTKGKGFRTMLRKSGYQVFLIHEFKSSCQCSKCQVDEARCEPFLKRLDPTKRSRRIKEKIGTSVDCSSASNAGRIGIVIATRPSISHV